MTIMAFQVNRFLKFYPMNLIKALFKIIKAIIQRKKRKKKKDKKVSVICKRIRLLINKFKNLNN